MFRAHFVLLTTAVVLGGCLSRMPIYPHPEPDEADETNLTPPKCDLAGQPRDCFYNVHFQKRGGITVMLAPQCAQVTITDEPPTGDAKKVRKSQTLIEPHEVTVVGDRDAQMEVAMCLQFPLRMGQDFIFERPTMVISPKGRSCTSTPQLMNGGC